MTTSPRWLNSEEQRAWLAYIDFSTLLADHLNRQLRRDAGVTHSDYSLLARLSAAPDRALTMSELAERLKVTRSRLTHAVTRLQQAGYVSRRDDPSNRRNQLAVLTAQGQTLLERAAPGHVEAVRRVVFDALTPEQVRHFAEIGETINSALQFADTTEDDHEPLPWRRR
ncbi:MarR family winged helix-turn-helix transcriptional regulator [Streptomyces neyagawaensis]|uniref:MarR family winged helix-turn-helix transcriptional regulator n=1 Tax=Streptomyces neyagawaensis TaxID=42238 RepID=UPI0006E1D1D2|nr:MarR family transcriptional regulator [Streptomyces neyagawaensis]MCL6735104.1 MarR family transcriptional regulator [Streptomyces neyagawaensis]MDE1687499.1 MarR family transcriptional regulator [Streptomyces neyagawaensis]